MQINLQGFLDKNSQPFVLELWKLLISAQTSLGGIPQQFLDQTKEELLQAKVGTRIKISKASERGIKSARNGSLLLSLAVFAARLITVPSCISQQRAKEAELAKIREQEAKERAIAEEVRQKAQAIRNATRPSASSLGNGVRFKCN